MRLPRKVSIVEVGPRDGLQNEQYFLATSLKLKLIDFLKRAGFNRIEATSFVRPEWIPQLGDAEEVIKKTGRSTGVRISALVPNYRGYVRARDCGVEEVNIVLSASEAHNFKNVNKTVKESLRDICKIAEAARGDEILVRGSVATSFGCPYQGTIDSKKVSEIVHELWNAGCYEVALADTIGVANPVQVYNIFSEIMESLPEVNIAAHFHDTRGMGLANVLAALQAGVAVYDSSIGGMGGCPYAPGASGNVATEDLVHMLSEMGIETGVGMSVVKECLDWMADVTGCKARGHVSNLGNR
ncbi:MAG: hydroxymethylglutaryl-CoA lyase [Bacillota bacterium]